jgi:hypothetical protein
MVTQFALSSLFIGDSRETLLGSDVWESYQFLYYLSNDNYIYSLERAQRLSDPLVHLSSAHLAEYTKTVYFSPFWFVQALRSTWSASSAVLLKQQHKKWLIIRIYWTLEFGVELRCARVSFVSAPRIQSWKAKNGSILDTLNSTLGLLASTLLSPARLRWTIKFVEGQSWEKTLPNFLMAWPSVFRNAWTQVSSAWYPNFSY